MTDLSNLKALMERATKGPWRLQDGCSWRRIGTQSRDGDVLCPSKQRDGQPDLIASDGKLYANLELIIAAVNALPSLIEQVEQQQARIAELTEQAARAERNRDMWKGQCERQAEALSNSRQHNFELLAALRLLIPTNLNVLNGNISDDEIIPVDFTLGDLRRASQALGDTGR